MQQTIIRNVDILDGSGSPAFRADIALEGDRIAAIGDLAASAGGGHTIGPVAIDGQGLVAHDILGIFDRFTPKFVKKYANLNAEILKAFKAYVREVTSGEFPADEHCFHIKKKELEKLQG